jgi:hypothetical protein
VASDEIQDGAVTTEKIADLSVTTAKVADGAITTEKIADDAITSEKILNGEIQTSDIADEAVTTAKLMDEAVTTAKIASNAVTQTAQSTTLPTGTTDVTAFPAWGALNPRLTREITTTGGPVLISVSLGGFFQSLDSLGKELTVGIFRLDTDTVLVSSVRGMAPYDDDVQTPPSPRGSISFTCIDQPSAGTYTYEVRVTTVEEPASYTITFSNPLAPNDCGYQILSLVELKR